MPNCLKGCVTIYENNRVKSPIDEALLMPWVEVRIQEANTDKKISVSNWSSRENMAVIKSFQFGMSNGTGVFIEVVDEEGGNFTKFFDKLTTGNQESAKKYSMHFKFGWATTGCDGSSSTTGRQLNAPTPHAEGKVSCEHTMVVRDISVNVSNGAFKYSIEATDLTADAMTTVPHAAYGEDKRPMRLVIAVEKLLDDHLPGTIAEFKQLDAAGKEEQLKFKSDGDSHPKYGPKGVWRTDNRNILSTLRNWMNTVVSARDRGIVIFWRTGCKEKGNKPTLVFMESNKIVCESVKDTKNFHVGTYVVNGGKCSPVLSFSPQIKYIGDQAFRGTSGVQGGALAGKQFVEDGPNPCMSPEDRMRMKLQGLWTTFTDKIGDFTRWFGDAAFFGGRNRMANQAVNLVNNPFTAELRIQGDPSYNDPLLCVGSYCTIVYINPFRIAKNQETGGETAWKALSGCNEQLSNTNWMIQKVAHEIKEGSFVTTLGLILATPGFDIPRDAKLGASKNGPVIG